MRAAGQCAATVLDRLCKLIRPGITTGEVDAAAVGFMRDMGCSSAFLGYQKFPGNICISVNEEVVHGIGGGRKLQYGDIVKLDVGVVKEGWIGDTAMTVPVGLIDTDRQRLLLETEGSLWDAIKTAIAGNTVGDIGYVIEKRVRSAGFSVVKMFAGHGVGRKLHEPPEVPNYGRKGSGPVLKPGMIIAIEPMVNMGVSEVEVDQRDRWTVTTRDRKHSAHFEHTVLITKGEPEILTSREKM